ncbi:MAG: hypothetical protein LBH21_06625 [Gracilibacteraceae bacterium]|jgi:hypothetical protein|nr:hypothetical protein [Gracilibacteraceae bacterium]
MGIREKLALRREQYGRLYSAGADFLGKKEPTMDDVEDLILARERCVLLLAEEPLLRTEHSRWREIYSGGARPADAEEEETARFYGEMAELNKKVLRQDQAVHMRLRWLERQYAGTPEPPPPRRKTEIYAEQPEEARKGQIYDRLR